MTRFEDTNLFCHRPCRPSRSRRAPGREQALGRPFDLEQAIWYDRVHTK